MKIRMSEEWDRDLFYNICGIGSMFMFGSNNNTISSYVYHFLLE